MSAVTNRNNSTTFERVELVAHIVAPLSLAVAVFALWYEIGELRDNEARAHAHTFRKASVYSIVEEVGIGVGIEFDEISKKFNEAPPTSDFPLVAATMTQPELQVILLELVSERIIIRDEEGAYWIHSTVPEQAVSGIGRRRQARFHEFGERIISLVLSQPGTHDRRSLRAKICEEHGLNPVEFVQIFVVLSNQGILRTTPDGMIWTGAEVPVSTSRQFQPPMTTTIH